MVTENINFIYFFSCHSICIIYDEKHQFEIPLSLYDLRFKNEKSKHPVLYCKQEGFRFDVTRVGQSGNVNFRCVKMYVKNAEGKSQEVCQCKAKMKGIVLANILGTAIKVLSHLKK